MKKFALFVLAVSTTFFSRAQTDSLGLAPYKRFPTVPPFKLLLTDSSSHFTKADLPKKKAVLLMLFSPDCDHCKHETEEIIKNVDAFKKVQIVMSTTVPFEKMRDYYNHYDLKRFDNIIVGKDVSYLLPVFYDIHNLPFLAFYNKKKELISVYSGVLPIAKVIDELGK
ncbi:MAG: TlpA family protein disulfide reductase [Chitinophagaceae bacterium]